MGSSGAGAEQGVLFPAGPDGRRSSGATGQAVWAQAVAGTDPDLARRVSGQADWRSGYLDAVVAHTAAAARSAPASVQVARAGLAALAERMVLVRGGGTAPLADGLPAPAEPLLATTLRGQGERVRELVVPYRGQELRGDALRRQVDAWADRGVVEPSCAQALHAVLDAPEQLDLSDRAFALLGAGAELGPLGPLSQWGAHVVAVDVPSATVWDRVRATAAAGSGTLTCPGGPQPGVDLLTCAPEVAAFLRTAADGLPLTVGSYAYADGARHVQLAAASDAVVARLLRERPGAGYAELATPTDAFAVPEPVVAEARRRFRARGASALVQRPLQAAGPLPALLRRRLTVATTAPCSASPTCWCRSRVPTTRSPSGCSAGGPSSPRPTGTRSRPTSRRRPGPARS